MMKERKKNWLRGFYLSALVLIFTGCGEDFVDIEPRSSVTSDALFASFNNTNIFLNQAYDGIERDMDFGLTSWFSVDPAYNWTDDSMATFGWPASRNAFARRDYSASNAPFGNQFWQDTYASIRETNILIEGIEGAPADVYTDDERNQLLGQSKFLRAFFYLRLAKPFGGVPIINKVLDRNSGDDIAFARSTFDETIDFIVADARAAADLLPDTWSADGSTRASKGAALALMADAQIFSERWADCVASCEEIMNLGTYNLMSDYSSIFQPANEDNSEVIFDIEYNETVANSGEVYLSPRIDPASGVAAGWGHQTPTQQLVDVYEFTDGLTIDDPSHASNPYAGRDARFYATILYNDSDWRGGKIITRFDPSVQAGEFSNTFDDNHSHQGTLTGYYGRKYLNELVTPSESTTADGLETGITNQIHYRYAEILLYYAEAKNEISGPDGAVMDAVNQLRARGGLQPLPVLGQAEMRDRIRAERRIELAFEGQKRYWDLIRWRIAGQVLNIKKQGMKITGDPNSLIYSKVDAFGGEMVFNDPRDYLMPIPQQAIEVNPKLEQNPGW